MGLLLGLSVCLVLGVGYWRMFSHFPGYDDEGYIMLTVRDYLAGGGLYGTVYTQYGPGFYVLMDVVFGLPGWAITHALVRWFTLGWWLAAAVGGAELVRHQTRKDGVAIAVGVLAGVVTVALVGGVVMLRGTSTVELLQGVLLGPLQHADDYSFAIDWRPGTLVNAILALGVLVGYVKLSRSEKNVPAKLGLVGLRPSS